MANQQPGEAELAGVFEPPTRSVGFGDAGTPIRPRPVIVTGGDDGLIRMWTPQGAPVAQQTRHTAPVAAVTTTIDDAHLQVWSADMSGRLLQRSLVPGVPVLSWPAPPGPPAGVTALGWAGTASYQMLVLGLDDGRVVRRSARSPDEVEVWQSHEGAVNAVALIGADDDFLIASAGADGVIRVRSGLSGTAWPDLPGHAAPVTGLSFGLIGDRLLLGSCGLDGTACTWDVHTREVLARWPVGDGRPAGLADARTGGVQRWVTGGADGVVRVWDTATGAEVHALRPGDATAVSCVTTALLPGITLVAAGYQDGTFCVWNAADGSLVGVDRSSAEALTSVEFGRDGRLDVFVGGTLAGSLHVYNPVTARLVMVATPHTDRVLSVAVAPARPGADAVIVSGGADRTVRVWSARTGWPLLYLHGYTGAVTAVAAGEVGGRAVVASGGSDGTVRLWDAGTGTALGRLAASASGVHALAIGAAASSGSEPVVVTGGSDEAVRVFRAADGALLLATDPVPGLVTSVAVGVWQGREVVVAAGANAGVRCWTLPAGDPVRIEPPPWPPLAVTLAPDGELWSIGTGGVAVIDPRRGDERG